MPMDVQEFLESLTDDVLGPSEYYDSKRIAAQLADLAPSLKSLEAVDGIEDARRFAASNSNSRLLSLLFGVRDRRDAADRLQLAPVIAAWRALTLNQDPEAVLTGILIAQDQIRRGRRARVKFEQDLDAILAAEVDELGEGYALRRKVVLAGGFRYRTYEYAVAFNGKNLLAIAAVYQSSSGGRQSVIVEDLFAAQDALEKDGIVLLLVADGSYFRTSTTTVNRMADSLSHVATLKQLKAHGLADIVEAAQNLKNRRAEKHGPSTEQLERISLTALRQGRQVQPQLLQVSSSAAQRFMIDFVSRHGELDLSISGPDTFAASQSQILESLQATKTWSLDDYENLARAIAGRLGVELTTLAVKDNLVVFGLALTDLQLRIPDPLPLFVPLGGELDAIRLLAQIDQYLSEGSFVSRIGVLVDFSRTESIRSAARQLRTAQRSQLVVVTDDDLRELLVRRTPASLQHFVSLLLQAVDLTYISPYISEGPTPRNMFYGRELEIRRVAEQIRNQSFALIGGRKVGKTSILQRLRSHLPMRDVEVHYINCEAHPDRQDFLELLQASLKGAHQGSDLIKRAEQILRSFLEQRFHGKFGVLLLDEVDELFSSDSNSESYPHILSHALRSVSQSRNASLVATGERALFSLTRDPSSPHWNFCTPIRVGPLDREAALQLMTEPMSALGISMGDEATELSLYRSANHPNLLQFLGTQIVEGAAKQSDGRATQASVEASDVSKHCQTAAFRARFISTFLSQATPLEKLISVTAPFGEGALEGDIQECLDENSVTASPAKILEALSFLELYSIIERRDDHYHYRTQVFIDTFQSLNSKLLLKQWRSEADAD